MKKPAVVAVTVGSLASRWRFRSAVPRRFGFHTVEESPPRIARIVRLTYSRVKIPNCITENLNETESLHRRENLNQIGSRNGSEFINNHLLRDCLKEQITFTRARDYRKNENCFVEQKNYSVVWRNVREERGSGTDGTEFVN